ncbi:PAS domain S-box protein [Nostoc sp. LEGE 06077]|uniref:PAS domain S-box protein n=1 Tax=Nostoc sp. LEGE 06077 TaxID=915325 RepID=UPI001880B983|nr:PAS domain S-box protein [Nostoc sp. LEGE 06077]MBE9207109.1 PAS domain S-box protein [Nostoc sp. LEGE 06077]
MYTRQQNLWLQSLEAVIDFSPLMVQPEATVSEVISLMAKCGVPILVVSVSQVLGWLTAQDVVKLLASGIEGKTTKITEVMQTPVITLKISEFHNMTAVLSLLRQHQLNILPILDEADQLIGIVTPESICQALEQSEQNSQAAERLRLLESAVVNANDSILITEAHISNGQIEPRIVYANQAFTQMTGYTLEEVIGQTPRFSHGEKTCRDEMNRLFAAVQAGLPIRTELLSYHKNGSTYWVDMNLVPIKNAQERITHFVAIHRNITERKLAEAALQWNEELFRQLTENLPQVFYVWDGNQQKLHYVSPAYERIWGRSGDRLMQNPQLYFAAIHPSDRDRVIAAFQNLLTGQSFYERYQIVRPDGEMRWISSKIFPIKNDHGQTYRFVAIDVDVTERIQAEAAMHESERRFRAIFNGTFQFSGLLTPEGNLLEANQTLLDFGGLQPQDVVGKLFWETQWWMISPAIQNQLEQAIAIAARGEFVRYEVEILGANQTVRTIDFSLKPLKDEAGKILLLISEGRDITELKQTQAALKEANQELERRVAQRTTALQQTNQQLLTEIAERKIVEEQLRQSQRILQLVMDTIPQGILWKDRNSVVLGCNRNFAKLVGVETPEDIVGKTGHEFLAHKSEADFHRECDLRVMQTNQPEYHLISPLRLVNGRQAWLETNKIPLHDVAGNVVGLLGTVEDITERQQAQEALEKSEARFRFLAESIPQQVWIADTNGNIEYVNQRGLDYFDCSLEQLSGWAWQQWLHPDDLEECLADWQTSLATGKPFEGEFRWLRGTDQTYRWHLARAVPWHDQEGKITAWFATTTDIDDRVTAELALKHSEQRFRNLVESSYDLIWEVDHNCVYTYVSPKIRDILGYEPETVLGKTPLDFMPPELHETLAPSFAAILAVPQPFQCLENIQVHQDGRLVLLETSGVPIFDQDDKFIGYRGTNRDITARKEAETVLKETQRQLQAILDHSAAAIYVVDTDNRFLLINRYVAQLLNMTQEQIIGKSIYELWTQEIADGFAVNNHQVLTYGKPIKVEEYVPFDDGLHTYFCVKFPLKDANGVPYAVCGLSTDITDRKLAEESLIRFHKAIESTSDAICMTDTTGKVNYVNSGFTEIYGYTLAEYQAAGGAVSIFKYQAELNPVLAAIESGESWRGEVTMKARNGRLLQVYLRANAMKDSTGKITGLVAIHTDITPRKQAEEGLRLRDRAIAASSNGIIIADASIPNGPIIYVNPAFERMTGYSAGEVIGTSFRSFHRADIEQPGLQELSAAMQAGRDCTVTLQNYRKNGSLWWNELNISPVYDVEGVLTHYIGIQTDITERKQTETALLVSQQRLQYLLSSSPAVIYTSKAAENFGATFVSNNISSITGYQPQDFTEDAHFRASHIHPEDVVNVLSQLSKILQQEHYSLEYRFLHKNGTYRWVSDQGKLVRDDIGNPVEMVGYLADITQRKQLEQELRVALEKEKELNELKSRFVSMTSHEFRTPLSTILSSAELLEHYRYKWTEEKQITHLHRIQAAVKRINEMLNDILVIGKAEAGKLEYRPTTFDLVAYCTHIIEEAQLNQNNRCLIFFTSQYPSILCCMDDKLLGHILNNLLSNAIKYSPEGSAVKLKLVCEHGQAILEIQDQGIGIPPEDLPYLFESFHRAKNVGNILGTGLGLTIVKKCIDIHKGEISVTSFLGIGTTFTVTLPLNNAMQIEGSDD